MQKINKILFKNNKNKLIKNKQIKKDILVKIKLLRQYGINLKVIDEISYFKLCIIYNSFKQKLLIENNYDQARTINLDLWSIIDYKEKNMLTLKQREIDHIELKTFKYDNKFICIAFFDELFNSLYLNEPAIFELKQFSSLYNQFKDHLINIDYYGLLPYRSGFLDDNIVYSTDDYICIYNDLVKKIYFIDINLNISELPLDKELCGFKLENELFDSFFRKNKELFLNCAKESQLLSNKTKIELSKAKL